MKKIVNTTIHRIVEATSNNKTDFNVLCDFEWK